MAPAVGMEETGMVGAKGVGVAVLAVMAEMVAAETATAGEEGTDCRSSGICV